MTYWRIVIKKNYIVESQIDCDPYTEACFIWECDPNSTVEGEACTGDPENDIWYYKLTQRKASKVPLCDPNVDELCDPWTCEPGEKDCSETLCNEETKIEQEAECNNPEEYTLNNPEEEEEEAVECEEGDEECLSAEEETACEEGDTECLSAEEDVSADEEEAASADENSVEDTDNAENSSDTENALTVPAPPAAAE